MSTLPHNPDHMKEAALAVVYCLAGWLAFSLCDTTSKWLVQEYHLSLIICLSSLPVAVVAAFMIIRKDGMAGFKTPDLKWHMARAMLVIATAIFAISGLRTLPMADFYGITFLAPFISALLAALFLKEQIGIHRLIAIIAGFGGVLVIAQPQFATYSIGILYTLGAVTSISLTAIVLRKIKQRQNVFLFAFFPSLFNSIVHAPLTVVHFQMPAPFDFAMLGLLSVFVMCGLLFISVGLRRAPAYAVVAPFQYTQIVYGIVLGYLVFGDIPAQTTIAGIGIIVLSGLYLIWREYKTHGSAKNKAERKMRLFSRSRG